MSGHYVAIRLGFAFPIEERNEFSKEWVEHYTQNALFLHDPVTKWVYENSGSTRWSELDGLDPKGVLAAAADFGMHYGVAVSYCDETGNGQRSFGSFARADREFSDDEIRLLGGEIASLHEQSQIPILTVAELEVLSNLKLGLRIKESAFQLGISESAVKQRLRGAKTKLGAQTNSQAVSRANEFHII